MRPKIRISRKICVPMLITGVFSINKGRGISRTISMSNTRNKIARRKNRIENGMRDVWLGSKPHSNGEVFSRSEVDRVERIIKIDMIIGGMESPVIRAIEVMYINLNRNIF